MGHKHFKLWYVRIKKKTQEWLTFHVCVLEQELEIVREEIANHHLKKI